MLAEQVLGVQFHSISEALPDQIVPMAEVNQFAFVRGDKYLVTRPLQNELSGFQNPLSAPMQRISAMM
jgi:hypothetical protein